MRWFRQGAPVGTRRRSWIRSPSGGCRPGLSGIAFDVDMSAPLLRRIPRFPGRSGYFEIQSITIIPSPRLGTSAYVRNVISWFVRFSHRCLSDGRSIFRKGDCKVFHPQKKRSPIGQTPDRESDKQRLPFRTEADTEGRRAGLPCTYTRRRAPAGRNPKGGIP